jgi:asparaginyl-tRNA synthetase
MPKQQIKQILNSQDFDQLVEVSGWVRNRRGSKNVAFVHLNDGSSAKNIQVVVDAANISEDLIKKITVGACLKVYGKLVASQGSEQDCEILASELIILGEADAEKYPLQAKAHSMEFLRENAHLRTRTATFGAIFRLRHSLGFAVHQYFNDRGFYYWQSPIITASDAEGAGETFRVTTLNLEKLPKTEKNKIDYKEDFFGREAKLTVSGQLEAELGALGLGLVYTFGPTFRAENSNTSRHLSEFWMIEPEMAFYEAKDNQDLAEDFLRYLVKYVLDNCVDDLAFLDQRFEKENQQKKKEEQSEMGLIEKLKSVVENDFERLTYTEAIDVLLNSKPHKKKKFKYPVEWGIDLQSEHERFLVEKHFKKPVILSDYPKEIKAFYMKQNEDGKTVRAMDVLFPGIGEIIGGSQREENFEKLKEKTDELGLTEELWWYLDTRRFGTAPHSGFGLGFERLVQFVTGMGNIRDVIPFPRAPLSADF